MQRASIVDGGRAEASLLRNVTSMLNGVPPPPSISVCSLTCTQLLESYYNNAHLNSFPVVPKNKTNNHDNPKVYYLNSSQVSEDFADMTMKLQRRLVQSETLSTFSVKPAPAPASSSSGFVRRLKAGTASPGRRLSHLARRRHVFSKDNLKHLAHNETKNVLTIATNNVDNPLPKRALFQSPDVRQEFKTVKRTPVLAVPRRRLFNEPENKPAAAAGAAGFSFTKEGYDVSTWLASQSFAGGRKRSRQKSTEKSGGRSGGSGRKRKCPRRSLDFSPPASQTSQASHPSTTGQTPVQPLTYIQKQKLLWAVSVALKEHSISHKHTYFKRCASALFNQSKKQIATILATPVASTSEKMLIFTREKAPQVISSIVPADEVTNHNQDNNETANHNKENQLTTPKRPIRKRLWKTCLKKIERQNNRLKRSVSLTDLSTLMLNYHDWQVSAQTWTRLDNNCSFLTKDALNSTKNDFSESQIVDDSFVSETKETSIVYNNVPSPDLFNNAWSPVQNETEDLNESIQKCLETVNNSLQEEEPVKTEEKLEISKEDTVPEEKFEGFSETASEKFKISEKDAVSETASEKLVVTCKRRSSWYSEPGPGLTLKMRFAQEWAVVKSLSESGSGTPSSCSSMNSYTLMEIRDRLAIERTLQADSSEVSWLSSNAESTDEASGAESPYNLGYSVPRKAASEKIKTNGVQ